MSSKTPIPPPPRPVRGPHTMHYSHSLGEWIIVRKEKEAPGAPKKGKTQSLNVETMEWEFKDKL